MNTLPYVEQESVENYAFHSFTSNLVLQLEAGVLIYMR